jgi:hypothetical protein
MKRLIVIIVFFFSIKGHSQRQVSDFKEMIDSAIYLKSLAFSKTAKNHTVRIAYNKDLYLIDENNFPYEYKGRFTILKFKAINLSKARNKSILKRGIQAWKIIPVLKGNKVTISIIDFFITYKNGNYNYANGGGSETVFEYLCSENKWMLIDFKNQGI